MVQITKVHDLSKTKHFEDSFLKVSKVFTTLMQSLLLVIKYIIGKELMAPFQIWAMMSIV
jgi:hypothetical protein